MNWWIGRECAIGKVALCRPSKLNPPRRTRRHLAGCLVIVVIALGSPFASAQNPQNPMRDFLGTITKGATDAVQSGVDKALGNSTGGNAANGNAANKTSGTQSQPGNLAQTPSPQASAKSLSTPAPSSTLARIPATQAQIDTQVEQFHRNCTTSNAYMRSLHECECISRMERNALETSRSIQPNAEQSRQMDQSCPAAKQVTYDFIYKSCDDHFQHNRSDYLQFCGCTAERFSNSYAAHPDSNLRKVEALRRESMQACGLGDSSHNIRQ